MCGRYASTKSATDLATIFEASDATDEETLAASYNVAPTDRVHIVRRGPDGDRREVATARWGLLPSWARSVREGARMINARAETLATSRAFRVPYARRRCLVPADGWYEWLRRPYGLHGRAREGAEARDAYVRDLAPDASRPRLDGSGRRHLDGSGRQPYYLTPKDGGVLAFAGLWDVWGPDRLVTTTIVTTGAVSDLTAVHDRMPLVVPPEQWAAWLTSAADPDALLSRTREDWAAGIELRQVGPAVGNVRNNSEALIRRVTGSALGVDATDPADLTLFNYLPVS